MSGFNLRYARTLGIFYLAGWQYREKGARDLIGNDRLKAGSFLELVKEPDNPVDPSAIKVCAGRFHLGYVPRQFIPEVDKWSKEYGERLKFIYHGRQRIRAVLLEEDKPQKRKEKPVKMGSKRQAVRIVPSIAEVRNGILYLNKVPYEAEISRIGSYYVAETKHNIAIVHDKDARRFRILDKEYKTMPEAVFVANVDPREGVTDIDKVTIIEWIKKTLAARPSQYTVNIIAKAWGELRSRELNTFPGIAFKTDKDNDILTRFKPNQIAARFQLYRPTNMPYVTVTLGGFNVYHVMGLVSTKPPIVRKNWLIEAMNLIVRKYQDIVFVPSGIGTALGDVFSKINTIPKSNPTYHEEDDNILVARVWNTQKDLGLGAGSMRLRRELQCRLPHSSLNRTIVVRVKKELFKKYIHARPKIERIGLIQSFKITNHKGDRVSIPHVAQKMGIAADKHFQIYRIDLIYNGRERGYYIKFYIRFSYHAIRTGDKILSYKHEFLKGVAVVDDTLEGVDIECTWDNIKGTDYHLIEHKEKYSLIKINPNALFVVERGTSNAKYPNSYSVHGQDAYEMMAIHELFPKLAEKIKDSCDPRLKLFPEAYNTLVRMRVTVNKEIGPVVALMHISKFIRGAANIFEEGFEGGYVIIDKRKFPLPSTELIMGMANQYDSGIAHSSVILRYMKTLEHFLSYDMVIDERPSKGKYEPNLKDYKNYAEQELYRFFKSPKLSSFSSIKRIVNHMEDVMPTVAAVRDNDSIFKDGKDEIYAVASVYPSVHILQVKHKFIKVIKFSKFKQEFFELTGKRLNISSIDDAILMNPHLVNSVFIKDNDGDALALRVLDDQELGKEIWKEVTKCLRKDIETIKMIADKREIWETQKPKERHPEWPVSVNDTINAMSAGIEGKLMIGMITRQGRKVQYALMEIARKYPKYKVLCEVTGLQIAKAMQDVIDGLKHERAIIEAAQLYNFLRDICVLSWYGKNARRNRARILGNLEKTTLSASLKAIIPLLKKTIDDSTVALVWLFGDQLPVGTSLAKAFTEFSKYFPKLSKVYIE